jgi:sulfate transport system permease protein
VAEDLLEIPSDTRAASRVEVPVLHPDRHAAPLPKAAWLVVVGGLLALAGAFLPWYSPSGEVDRTTPIPNGDLHGWNLIGVGFAGALALGVVAAAGGLALATHRRGLLMSGRARKAVSWAAMAAALVSLAGVYFDWRYVPERTGVGMKNWETATISGFHVTTGAGAGVWLVVIGAGLALLGSASVLKIVLRVVALGYLGGLVVLPAWTVIGRTFDSGAGHVWDVITTDQEFLDAVKLTIVVAGLAVVLNTIFGLGIALLLTRYRFPGRRILGTLIDLPLAISPVVVGVALILVFGQNGWFGSDLEKAGIQVIFATPGMVLATIIVALPLVVRELVPVLEEAGIDQEQAAQSLGANAMQTFRRITLPTIKWALAYGVVLSLARSIGEFGAVRVVSQSVSGQSQTVTLWINREYEQLGPEHQDNAFIGSFVLMVLAIILIVVIALLRPREHK